jgi:FkbM family methyltransferase
MLLRFLYRNFKARYRDQPVEIRAILEGLQPGSVAIDVGANKGSYLYWLSRAVGKGRVYAFEPQRRLAEYLSLACARAGLDNVSVKACAVGDRSGEATMYIPGASEVSPGASLSPAVSDRETCASETVEVVTLDEYLASEKDPIRALKIDVEGHELAVLRGARKILETHSPVLVFECERRHLSGNTMDDVFDFLKALDYDGDFIHRRRLLPLSQFDPEIHQRQDGERFWTRADYCNNFVLRRNR